jgi:hypothetical protein
VSNLTGAVIGDIGTKQTWTVTLSSAAPTGGLVVKLASSAPTVATVPASVTVLAGQTQVSFSLTVVGFGISTISAVKSGNVAFGAMTANFGWNLNDLTGAVIPYGPEDQTTFTLTTSQPGPPGGLVVKLDSGGTGIAGVPATVTVPNGSTTVTFPVTRTRDGVALIKASLVNSSITKAVNTAERPRLGGGNDDSQKMSFFKCANEGGTCPVGGPPRYLAYGVGGNYKFQAASGNVPCNDTQFGDPNTGNQTNACYYSSYGFLAAQGASVSVPGQVNVAYGANGVFVFKDMTGSFACNDTTFPNAITGTKACYYGPVFYDVAASEGQTFSVNANTPVAYGGGGNFAFKLMSGSVGCNNTTFGDPASGTTKSCYLLAAPFRSNESQPFSTSGLTATYYGSGINGNFIVSGATSGTCSNAFFGLDPDVTRGKHCYGL